MKSLIQITRSENVRNFTESVTKLMDIRHLQNQLILSQILSPEWGALKSGLKKLIEKDYFREEDPDFLSLTNS
jgi:hypothetical protein